jgi:hypothetical protein
VTGRVSDRAHALLMLVAAVGTTAYWVAYFTNGATQVRADAEYLAFEDAFPLADGWMTLCFLLGARGLWRGHASGVRWGLCAGSAMIFLGCMGLLYDLQHGHFRGPPSPALLAEVVVLTYCFTFGPFTLIRLWRRG